MCVPVCSLAETKKQLSELQSKVKELQKENNVLEGRMAEEIVKRVDEANDLLTRTHSERLEKVCATARARARAIPRLHTTTRTRVCHILHPACGRRARVYVCSWRLSCAARMRSRLRA